LSPEDTSTPSQPAASASAPPASSGAPSPTQGPLLSVRDLRVEFSRAGKKVQAVSGVSFDLEPGETLGLVGESGCGKSTTGRAVAQIIRPTSGTVLLGGVDLTRCRSWTLRRERVRLQMIFQDPISSLNPRRRIRDIVAEPLDIWKTAKGEERTRIVNEMLEAVGLSPELVGASYPRQFSGGQCQRISIARALVMRPQVLICDEIVSSLDVSIQAQILNLVQDLKEAHGLTMLFIAHDLAVVKNVSDRVAVMYLGKICELAPADDLYREPRHPYTNALLASAVEPDPTAPRRHAPLQGEPPSPVSPPSGCRFRTRCPNVQDRCATEEPKLEEITPGHRVACHFPVPVRATAAATAAAPAV
jgi:peptide/nickel transport system ATP-binding protein